MKNIAVFCGSSFGKSEEIVAQTKTLGALLGKGGYNVIYGGGTSGLMGAVSKAAIENGAKVKGIIPKIFQKAGSKEQGALEGSDDHIVEDMFDRKKQMIFDCDAAIALPGGWGTLDEIFEMLVAQYLKTFAEPDAPLQPMIIINYNGYYDPMIEMLERIYEAEFQKRDYAPLILVADDAAHAIELLNEFRAQNPTPARDFKSFKPS